MTEIKKPVRRWEAEPLAEPIPGEAQPAVPPASAPSALPPAESVPTLVPQEEPVHAWAT